MYRKYPKDVGKVILSLQKLVTRESDIGFDREFFDVNAVRRDRNVVYRLAMSGTREFLFVYLQDKNALVQFAKQGLFEFKKKALFIECYKHFINPTEITSGGSSETIEDKVFRISANLENYCRALSVSCNKVSGVRNSIALLRFLFPLVDSFSQYFSSSATLIFLMRASCWKIVRLILFTHEGQLAPLALNFLLV